MATLLVLLSMLNIVALSISTYKLSDIGDIHKTNSHLLAFMLGAIFGFGERTLPSVAEKIEALRPPKEASQRQQSRRQALPANLPRREIRHEPADTTCGCGCQMKRIGENIAEKLHYVPGVFSVERHIRGK